MRIMNPPISLRGLTSTMSRDVARDLVIDHIAISVAGGYPGDTYDDGKVVSMSDYLAARVSIASKLHDVIDKWLDGDWTTLAVARLAIGD